MPQLSSPRELDFLRRQVLTARNLGPGTFTTLWTGGLNHQIEHHLFPSVARPHLGAVRRIVHTFCAEHGVRYTEQGFITAFTEVITYMNRVGARSAFTSAGCPVARSLGR